MAVLNPEKIRKVTVTVPCRLGIHARCAARIVELVKPFQSEIRICKGGAVADGKSILQLLMLGAAQGAQLEFEVVGEDAGFAVRTIERFFGEADYCADH